MHRRCRDEVDVVTPCARERAEAGASPRPAISSIASPVLVGHRGRSDFQLVDAEAVEQLGELESIVSRKGDASLLLAVPKRAVRNLRWALYATDSVTPVLIERADGALKSNEAWSGVGAHRPSSPLVAATRGLGQPGSQRSGEDSLEVSVGAGRGEASDSRVCSAAYAAIAGTSGLNAHLAET